MNLREFTRPQKHNYYIATLLSLLVMTGERKLQEVAIKISFAGYSLYGWANLCDIFHYPLSQEVNKPTLSIEGVGLQGATTFQ